MGSTVLITGITGQVGSHLADFLLQESRHDVVGMMRWQEPLDNLYHLTDRMNRGDRISVYTADLIDFPALARLISEVRPTYISHLAAQSYPRTSFEIPIETLHTNILGTANLLEAIRQQRQRDGYDPVVHVCSSSEVYGRARSDQRISEDTPFHAASPYSISKIGVDYLGRFYGEAYGLRTFVTRMGTHSGPRRSDVFFESTVAKQIALIEAGLQHPTLLVGNLSSTRTYQDARDAVRAYVMLLEASAQGKIPPGECYNIAGEEVFTLTEVLDLLLGLSSHRDIQVVVDQNRLRPIDADYQMFDNTKIRSAIDWRPEIPALKMFEDLLIHWRREIAKGRIPLNR